MTRSEHQHAVGALSLRQRRVLRRALEERSLLGTRLPPRLVAYLRTPETSSPSAEELRRFLADRLPEYMIPLQFERRDSLPRLPSGKLDREALGPISPAEPPDEFCDPRTETEVVLASIWKEVLELDRVSVFDDFFEVGGDSLISIRVLARARRAGLVISTEAFFERPTIAALAAHTDTAPIPAPPQGDAPTSPTGAPLTPIQHWFFERIPSHQHHWNQSILLAAPADLEIDALREIVRSLCQRHDALRVAFEPADENRRQVVTATGGEPPIRHERLDAADVAQRPSLIASVAADVHGSLTLEDGGLVRFVLFDAGPEGDKRLLIVAHHLVVDAVSWDLLLDDLDTLYRRVVAKESVEMPLATHSWARWSTCLANRAGEFVDDAEYWVDLQGQVSDEVPLDHPFDPDRNLAGTARSLTREVDVSFARASGVPKQFSPTPVADILLAALAWAWADWSDQPRLYLDLEGHGRDVLADELDASRTVGWFATVFPVAVSLAPVRSMGDPDPSRLLRTIVEQIGRVRHLGAAHGISRYLGEPSDFSSTLAMLPRPRVLLNYLGRRSRALTLDSPFRRATEPHGPDRHPMGQRAYLLELNCQVEHDRLQIRLEYHPAFHEPDNAERLADRFVECLEQIVSGVTVEGRVATRSALTETP